MAQAREDLAGDLLVAAVGEPAAARRVAPADVDGPGHPARALDGEVVDLGVGGELGRHVVAPALEGRAVVGVHVPLGVVRRVELDVVPAARDQGRDHARAQVIGDGAQEVFRRGIGGPRVLGVPEDAMPARRRNGQLAAHARVSLEKGVLVLDDVAHDLDPPGDERPLGRRPHGGLAAVGLLPQRPPAGVGGQEVEAGQGRARHAFLA